MSDECSDYTAKGLDIEESNVRERLSMKLAIAESVAAKLADSPDVVEAHVNQNGPEVSVTAVVYSRHCRRRVKRTLHQYPLYVELEVQDEADADADSVSRHRA